MSDNIPTVKLLAEELKDVTRWYAFGVALGIPVRKLGCIEQEKSTVEDRKIQIFEYWLNNDQDASWGMVIQALEQIDHSVLAEELKKKYQLITAAACSSKRDSFDSESVASTWLNKDNSIEPQLPELKASVETEANECSPELLSSQSTIAATASVDESDGTALSTMELSLEQDKENNPKRHHHVADDYSAAPEQKRLKSSHSVEGSLSESQSSQNATCVAACSADDGKRQHSEVQGLTISQEPVLIDDIPVKVPRVDTSYLPRKPGFKKKTISAATRINEFTQEKSNEHLLYLARNNLQEDIRKWEKQQSRRSAAAKPTKLSQDGDQKRNEKKAQNENPAKEYYEKTHKDADVDVIIMDQLLTDPKEQINGRVFYQLQIFGEPVGFLHIEMKLPRKFKADIDKNGKLYNRIQALLYAGEKEGFNYCDIVCYENLFYERITADEEWRSTVAQRAHQYCDYYDQLWAITQQQYE